MNRIARYLGEEPTVVAKYHPEPRTIREANILYRDGHILTAEWFDSGFYYMVSWNLITGAVCNWSMTPVR